MSKNCQKNPLFLSFCCSTERACILSNFRKSKVYNSFSPKTDTIELATSVSLRSSETEVFGASKRPCVNETRIKKPHHHPCHYHQILAKLISQYFHATSVSQKSLPASSTRLYSTLFEQSLNLPIRFTGGRDLILLVWWSVLISRAALFSFHFVYVFYCMNNFEIN